MAFANTLVLDAASGADVTYVRRSSDANGSSYIDQATTLVAPGILSIRHSLQGKGSDAIDRHLVQLARTVVDANGRSVVLTVNFTVAVPRNTAVTPTIVKDAITNVLDFFTDGAIATLATSANIDALLRGEA
jgi:hypothetical protein